MISIPLIVLVGVVLIYAPSPNRPRQIQAVPLESSTAMSTSTTAVDSQSGFSAAPRSGNAPLEVTFEYTHKEKGNDLSVDFGDGYTGTLVPQSTNCNSPNEINCAARYSITHMYWNIGRYIATLQSGGGCGSDTCDASALPQKISSVRIIVTGTSSNPLYLKLIGFGDTTEDCSTAMSAAIDPSTPPSCTVTTDKTSYHIGDNVTIKVVSENAIYTTGPDGMNHRPVCDIDVWGGVPSGTHVFNYTAYGPGGMAHCSASVLVH